MGRFWSHVLWSALILTTLWSLRGVKGHLNLFISQEEVRKLLGKYPVRTTYIFVTYWHVVIVASISETANPRMAVML
jgi:hypothetical protein